MTRLTRTLVAGLVGVAAILLSASPSGAGAIAALTGEETCNTATGEYQVVFTQTTPSETQDVTISVETYEVDGGMATPPSFSPNPMPPNGQATATVTVPGSTTSILLATLLTADLIGTERVLEMTLDGDCEPPPTTTTAEGETTTTEAAAAEAVRLQPAFTG
jgi:hypothetical protein